MQAVELTIFYDSSCPLCVAEMNKLKRWDRNRAINFISLHDDDLLQVYPELDIAEAMTILQGRLSNGKYIEGLDVTHKAWSLVGKGFYTSVLRWPLLKHFFDICYRIFAKHRYRLSGLLTGRKFVQPKNCQCGITKKS